jgi:hypothetical protein
MEHKYVAPTEYNGHPIKLANERCPDTCAGCVFDHLSPMSDEECSKATRNKVCDGLIFVYDDPVSRIMETPTELNGKPIKLVPAPTRGSCEGCVMFKTASQSWCARLLRHDICDGQIFVYDDPVSRIAEATCIICEIGADLARNQTKLLNALQVINDNLQKLGKE